MKTSYTIAAIADAEELTKMSMELYNETISNKNLLDNKIVATLRFYQANRNMGEIVMISYEGQLAGYAILFRFWSDEYGGLMVGIDELFIMKEFRGQGVAKSFFESFISREKLNRLFAGIEFEIHAKNHAADGLLASIGAVKSDKSFYLWLFRGGIDLV